MNNHKTREGFVSIFTKTIGICPEDLEFIKSIRQKKSAAGKLKEIITFYKLKNKLKT